MLKKVSDNLMTWLYATGLVAGVCLMGSEGETLTQTITGGIIGLSAVILFGILLAAEKDKL